METESPGKQNPPLNSHRGGLGRGRAAFTPAASSLGPRGLQLEKQQGQGKETSSQSSLDVLHPSLGHQGLRSPYFCDPAGVCSDFGVRIRVMLCLAAALVGTRARTEPRTENSSDGGVSAARASSAKQKNIPC